MFWFDKAHENTLYIDSRTMERQEIWRKENDVRYFEVKPDVVMDFRKMTLPDESFSLVVFDPPHLMKRNGKTGYVNKKYGSLGPGWEDDIRAGFSECFRVLRPHGTLIFKWATTEVPLSKILALTPHRPLFGNKQPHQSGTHWIVFSKG